MRVEQSSYVPPGYCNDIFPMFIHESREAALVWLRENESLFDGTPIFPAYRTEVGFSLLTHLDTPDFVRVMSASITLRHKKTKEKIKDWLNRHKEFAPHLNDLVGDIPLVKGEIAVAIERAEKKEEIRKVGVKILGVFQAEIKNLEEEVDKSGSNDSVKLNSGRFTQRLSRAGIGLAINTGVSYFIEKDKPWIHIFRKANPRIAGCLTLKGLLQENQPTQVLYHKTENNHYLPFLKDWAKGTVFAAITAIGAGLIASIFLVAFIAAPIAVITFLGLSVVALYKASKDNPTTIEHGNTEFKTIKPEAAKQKDSIFNQLKSDLLMVLAYFKGKSSEVKQAVNPVSQPVQPEVAALQPLVTEQAKVTRVEQNPIPRRLSTDHIAKERSPTIFVEKPVAKIAPICVTELPEQQVKNDSPSFFKKAMKRTMKVVEAGLKYQGCSTPYPMIY